MIVCTSRKTGPTARPSCHALGGVNLSVDDAYARLDAIAEKLQRDGAPPDYLELYVVDADRHPVARPVVQ